MVEQVEALPEVEAGLPGSAAPAASWLLPAAPVESGPAAASAGMRSCEAETRRHHQPSDGKTILCFLKKCSPFRGAGSLEQSDRLVKHVTKSRSCFQFTHDTTTWF